MTKLEMSNEEIIRLVIEKHLEYQLALINRRWQYFATYLLLSGALFNVWKDIGTSEQILVTLLSTGSLIIAITFLQLISLATKRVERSQIYLLKTNANVFDFSLDGKLLGETVMLYVAFISISVGWFYLLFVANYIIGVITSVIFMGNLFTLKWRSTKISNLS